LFRLLDECNFETHVPHSIRNAILGSRQGWLRTLVQRLARKSPEIWYENYVEQNDDERRQTDAVVVSEAETILNKCVPDRKKAAEILSCLDDLLIPGLDREYARRVTQDLASRIVLGRSDYRLLIHTYSHEPSEMEEELDRHGFHSMISAHEGHLIFDKSVPRAEPIYDQRLGVFETIARAPNGC
jgi:hypothetical protein